MTNSFSLNSTTSTIAIFFSLVVPFGTITSNTQKPRDRSPSVPAVFFTSVPKCGTNLLRKCFELLLGRKGICLMSSEPVLHKKLPPRPHQEFLFWHVPYSKDVIPYLTKAGYKLFFIYRDPRDQVISHTWWYLKYPHFCPYAPCLSTFPYLLYRNIENVVNLYEQYLPWLEEQQCCSIRFEDLVGPQGKGSYKAQLHTLKAICNFLEITIDQNRLERYARQLFGDRGGTFREGQIGSWKVYFNQDPAYKKFFKKVAGPLVTLLGYEKHKNW